MKNTFFLLTLALFHIFSCEQSHIINKQPSLKELTNKEELDSLIHDSYNPIHNDNQQIQLLNKVIFLIESSKLKDSSKLKKYRDLTLKHFGKKSEIFIPLTDRVKNYALKLNDSSTLGDIYKYKGRHYLQKTIRDSAFYYFNKSKNIFLNINDQKKLSYMYYYLGALQVDVSAYMEAEINLSKALKTFSEFKMKIATYRGLNQMGIKCKNSGEYDLALDYYNRALKFAPDQEHIESIYNNIGTTYQFKNHHKKALEYFQKIKTDDTHRKNDINFFAKIRGNVGFSKLKSGQIEESLPYLNEAIFIGDSINDPDIVATNKLRLAEYYAINKDTLNAIHYVKESMMLAKSTNNYRDYLKGLKQLSNLDITNSPTLLKEHIRIKDSITREEKLLHDKFARIAYETYKVEEENKILNGRILRNTIIGALLIVIGLMLYILLAQRAKNAKLAYERDQQKSNQEIYSLLLAQQYKLEEGKQLEKQRISEELHDGILGRLFGTRLSLGSLNTDNGSGVEAQRALFIEEIKSIEEEIRNLSHELHSELGNEQIDFISLIKKNIAQKCQAARIKLKFLNDDDIEWDIISGNIKINLYRILQEATKNCIKYANCTQFHVEFNKKDSYISLHIKDDGIGFDIKEKKAGIGIKNMRSRIKKVKGSITVSSKPNKGTVIKIKVPIDEEIIHQED